MLSMAVLASHIKDALEQVPGRGFNDMVVSLWGSERPVDVAKIEALEHALEVTLSSGLVVRVPYNSIDYYKAHSVGVLEICLVDGTTVKLRGMG